MVSRAIWKNIHSWVFQRLQIALVLRTRAILIVFEKLTRACFFQIALETILLPIQIALKYNESAIMVTCEITINNLTCEIIIFISGRKFYKTLYFI